MSAMLKKKMIERWASGADFEINKSLKKEDWRDKVKPNIRFQLHPFGMTDRSKIDLRGFPFREPLKYQYIKGIDFSYSVSVSGNQEGYGVCRGVTGVNWSIFENCDFVCAKLPANLGEQFDSCDFSEAVFESTKINAKFNNCIFVKSKMKNVIGDMSFINCDFGNASFAKSNFQFCYFENCNFEGASFSKSNFSNSTFIGGRPSDQQLAECSLAEKIRFS